MAQVPRESGQPEEENQLKDDMIYLFCKCSSSVTGTEMHKVASAPTLARALDVLRKQYKAGVAVHHPHFGRDLYFSKGWHAPYQSLISN
jgi:hypothetical protein